jgi:hypothetical protein
LACAQVIAKSTVFLGVIRIEKVQKLIAEDPTLVISLEKLYQGEKLSFLDCEASGLSSPEARLSSPLSSPGARFSSREATEKESFMFRKR